MFGLPRKQPLGSPQYFGLKGELARRQTNFGLASRLEKIWNVNTFTTLLTTGDSIALGTNATAGNSYRELLVTKYGFADEDLSVGGRGYYQQAANANDLGLAYTRSVTIAMDETGLNDIRRSVNEQTQEKVKTCLHTMLARFFSASATPSGHANVTRSGTFSGFNAASVGGTYGTGTPPGNFATTSSTVGNTWTWTFTGRHFAIGFSGSFDSTNARGEVEVYCDGVFLERINLQGVFYDGVSDGTNDNKRGPVTRVYWDFNKFQTHTVVVKVVSASNCPIDKFMVLDEPENLGIFFLVDIPKINDYFKPGLSAANEFWIDYFNDLRWSVVDEYRRRGYKCQRVRINAREGGYYTLEGVDSTDYVHPLNYGHQKIFQSIDRYLTKWG